MVYSDSNKGHHIGYIRPNRVEHPLVTSSKRLNILKKVPCPTLPW